MENSVIGELLILFLLILCCGRMFFLKFGRIDSLAILAPICVALSVLQILAWNVDFFSIVILCISIFSFFTNFRALLRLFSGLFIDHYSLAFKSGAIFVLLFSFMTAFFLIKFYPHPIKASSHGVKKETFRLKGTFNGGFEKALPFELSNGILFKYEPIDNAQIKNEKIIVIPDKRADSISYFPYMILLSKKGYSVYSADFFSKDLRWTHNAGDSRYFRHIYMILDYLKVPEHFKVLKDFFSYNSLREIKQMVRLVQEDSPNCKVFIIGDWMANAALDDFAKENGENLCGTLKLDSLEDYATPGFGFVQLTSPFNAYLLNFPADRTFERIEKLAEKTLTFLPAEEKGEE